MKILILPYSKYKNPYQKILIGELCQLGHKVYHGSHEVIFPIIKNYKRYKPNYIIIDWYHQWYLKEKLIITIIRLYTMLVDYIIVSKYYKIPIIQNMHNIEHHNNKKYISIQRMALKYILKIVSDIRFFTQGQKNKVLSLNFVVEKKKNIWVVAEESKVEYYLKKEIKENNIIQKNSKNNYLIFGSDRKNKNLNKFLINNINIEDNTIYYYTDINISNNVRIDKKMNVELIHINGDDCNVNQLFTKMDAIIIPYNNDILNSGILSMARDYNLPVIGMEYLMKLYELNSKKVTSYMIDNNRLIYYEHKKKYVNDNWKKILS